MPAPKSNLLFVLGPPLPPGIFHPLRPCPACCTIPRGYGGGCCLCGPPAAALVTTLALLILVPFEVLVERHILGTPTPAMTKLLITVYRRVLVRLTLSRSPSQAQPKQNLRAKKRVLENGKTSVSTIVPSRHHVASFCSIRCAITSYPQSVTLSRVPSTSK